MSKQKYHDHPMWWYCIGEAIFVHWLLNQTDISQWDLLINISQIDRNFRAKLHLFFDYDQVEFGYTVIASTYVPQKSLRDPQSNVAMENHLEMEDVPAMIARG